MALPGKLSMKLLINDKEISQYLITEIKNFKGIEDVSVPETRTAEAILWSLERKEKLHKFKDKIQQKIHEAINDDTLEYVKKIQITLENNKKHDYTIIRNNVEKIIDNIDIETIFKNYRTSKKDNFVKSAGLYLDNNSAFVRRKDYVDFSEDCLFRNMDGNENLLLQKMNNNWPFWFIDTGYTNFLHGKNKKWHRLVRNDLHHSTLLNVPADRLGIFESFPQPWRETGDKILIIEPGNFCAKTFGIDIEKWKKDTIQELRQYTDKKIIIREKLSKKVRKNLYKELCDDDYYCVVNINSNAATEAVWAGVPSITLARHITNPITKNKISDINNLYKGNISQWLTCLSYSQFTYDELVNGTAVNIVKKYHV
jgi:hypothetical protein